MRCMWWRLLWIGWAAGPAAVVAPSPVQMSHEDLQGIWSLAVLAANNQQWPVVKTQINRLVTSFSM